jgi:hypothetical protein
MNMLYTAEIDMANLVKASDIDIILSDAAWAIRSIYHTVLKASPGAAIFGRDMLFDIPLIADWKKIGEHRQRLTDLNTALENEGRIDNDYRVGQKVLVQNDNTPHSRIQVSKRALDNYTSPYKWNNHSSMQKQI